MRTATKFHLTWLRVLLIGGLLLVLTAVPALARVWTDQQDYAPGSVVTILGDNNDADGANYLAGETVLVQVTGPNGYASECSATVSDDPAANGLWSCTVTLPADESAIGNYAYTATGQTSGLVEGGTFTDGAVKVQARPKGVTFTITYQVYGQGDLTCSGGYTTNAKSVDALNDTTTGQGNTYGSILLIAPAASDQGSAFLYWTGPDSDSTFYSSSQSICVSNPSGNVTYYAHYAPVQVTKTAVTTFTRTYTWSIAKAADPTEISLFTGGSGDSSYTIDVVKTGYTDSDWAVSGTITVRNTLGAM